MLKQCIKERALQGKKASKPIADPRCSGGNKKKRGGGEEGAAWQGGKEERNGLLYTGLLENVRREEGRGSRIPPDYDSWARKRRFLRDP